MFSTSIWSDPDLSLLDKTRIQAQVLVPVMRAPAGRTRPGQGAMRSSGARCATGRNSCLHPLAMTSKAVRGRKWAAMHQALAEVTEREVTFDMLRQDEEALEFNITSCRFAEFFRALGEPNSARCWSARPTSTLPRPAKAGSNSAAPRPSCRARPAAPSATSSPDRRVRLANRFGPADRQRKTGRQIARFAERNAFTDDYLSEVLIVRNSC